MLQLFRNVQLKLKFHLVVHTFACLFTQGYDFVAYFFQVGGRSGIRIFMDKGNFVTDGTVDPIIELLWGDDAVTRRACIAALGKLGAPRAVKPILDTHEYETEEAVVAYGLLEDELATETLVKVLLSEPSLREQATTSLLAIKDPRTLGFIHAGLEECVFSFQIKQKIWKSMYGNFEIPEGEEYPEELPQPEYEEVEEEEEEKKP